MDRATEAMFRGRGENLAAQFGRLLRGIHAVIPVAPVSRAAALSVCGPDDDVDRISALPDELLHNIVSRLPVKDAAGTAALSSRWRGVWHSAPLVLVDSQLLRAASGQLARAEARRVSVIVSQILDAHPGPFRCVHLTCSYLEPRWLETFAVKGVQELVLVNAPFPPSFDLPGGFYSMASTLTRLYIGLFKVPDSALLPRAAPVSFPHLRELGICTTVLLNRDMEFLLARSPVLETLCVQANLQIDRLRLVSRSLRCVQLISATDLEIALDDAPHLERLIVWSSSTKVKACKVTKISRAPALTLLGYLDPQFHKLQLGSTVIKDFLRALKFHLH